MYEGGECLSHRLVDGGIELRLQRLAQLLAKARDKLAKRFSNVRTEPPTNERQELSSSDPPEFFGHRRGHSLSRPGEPLADLSKLSALLDDSSNDIGQRVQDGVLERSATRREAEARRIDPAVPRCCSGSENLGLPDSRVASKQGQARLCSGQLIDEIVAPIQLMALGHHTKEDDRGRTASAATACCLRPRGTRGSGADWFGLDL